VASALRLPDLGDGEGARSALRDAAHALERIGFAERARRFAELADDVERRGDVGDPVPDAEAPCVGGDAAWFRLPRGETVDPSHRRPLRRVLDALARHRLTSPGTALSREALVAAGWPGARMMARAGAHHLRVAIATLRKLGLREAIRTADEGYVLRVSSAPSSSP